MKTQRIIEVILNTPALSGSRIALAAYLAASGYEDCRRDVEAWWIKQGGTVQP